MTLRSAHEQRHGEAPVGGARHRLGRGGLHHAAPSRRRHRASHATDRTERGLWMVVGGLGLMLAFSIAFVAIELVT